MDCLKRFRAVAVQHGLDIGALDAIDAAVLSQIDSAVGAAKASAPPAESDLLTDVYVSY